MIKFVSNGKGNPIILIHGFCESKEMWITFSRELAKTHIVYCIDLPGFGESPLQQDSITLEEVAVMLHDWMEEEGIQNPAVIGHSLGGYVTLALAELIGNDLAAIGLFHSTAFPDDEEKKKTRNKTITFIKKHGVDKFIDSFVPPLFSEQHRITHKNKIEELTALGKKSSKKGVLAYLAAMRDRKDRMEVWKNFNGKKLMIAGVLDGAVKIEGSRMHKPYTDDYFELQEVGHMGMFEAEQETLIILQEFLRKLG
ncbi:alpha/beta fold hydrolase [Aquiflexum gelatinilyticum]|uniref:alpha/beta fold hydrolase n=1 Tax=Aquiflexum gelatinilyticum TaxID=2961943 RepID=UPI002166CAD5|nr:alpha/beta hydrolase [Aquiflexum gelatinilyticum]MCS4433800.1 alpha/beta hydrolase [Aquiflexum gelatinilyticum]